MSTITTKLPGLEKFFVVFYDNCTKALPAAPAVFVITDHKQEVLLVQQTANIKDYFLKTNKKAVFKKLCATRIYYKVVTLDDERKALLKTVKDRYPFDPKKIEPQKKDVYVSDKKNVKELKKHELKKLIANYALLLELQAEISAKTKKMEDDVLYALSELGGSDFYSHTHIISTKSVEKIKPEILKHVKEELSSDKENLVHKKIVIATRRNDCLENPDKINLEMAAKLSNAINLFLS